MSTLVDNRDDAASSRGHPREAPIRIATLSLYRFAPRRDLPWLFGQLAVGRAEIRRVPGCTFAKLCVSGTGEGFTPRPNLAVWAVLAEWRDEAAAARGLAGGLPARWRRRAKDSATLYLSPVSRRGTWAGAAPFAPAGGAANGPVAVLTRGQIRLRHLPKFWDRIGDISAAIGADPNVAFKIGLGEMPLRNQITFSVWPDTRGMTQFAHRDGPHARAIRAVRDGDWFAEDLYARFAVTAQSGDWPGLPHLAPAAEAA